MPNFALVEAGIVRECRAVDGDIASLFHPEMQWVELDAAHANVAPGWGYVAGEFTPPVACAAAPVRAPTLAELQGQLAQLSARIAELASPGSRGE